MSASRELETNRKTRLENLRSSTAWEHVDIQCLLSYWGHSDLGDMQCQLGHNDICPGSLPKTMSGSMVFLQPESLLMSVTCVATKCHTVIQDLVCPLVDKLVSKHSTIARPIQT